MPAASSMRILIFSEISELHSNGQNICDTEKSAIKASE
jgi:hypothetical protein